MLQPGRYRQINRVYRISLAANLLMLALKLGVGLLTGSLAMVADAMDSFLDAVASLIAMVMTRIAEQPPDAEHPYGHRRFETLAAMIIGGLLLLTASEVVQNGIQRLITGVVPQLGPANFGVMIIALGVNIALFFYQRRTGQRLRSEALRASAEDKRGDIAVSITVLVSLLGVELGMGWFDAVAALLVVALIGRTAWHVVSRSAGVLVDRVALDPTEVKRIADATPGIHHVTRVRSRGPEDDIHLDMDVQIAAPTTTAHSATIAEAIRSRLQSHFEGLTDIQITFLPSQDAPLDYTSVVRAEAEALGLGVHRVTATRRAEGLMLDMHVEVAADQSIRTAHTRVSRFEAQLRRALPTLTCIVTHIEPAYKAEECLHPDRHTPQALAEQARHVVETHFPDKHWHSAKVYAEAGGYALSLHCRVDGDMPLEAAHRLTEQAEAHLHTALPTLSRVTIHIEPLD